MNIQTHLINNTKVAEVISDEMIIRTAEDGLGLLGDIYYQGFDNLIIYDRNITVDFFDLKNRIAGEILQKFSNYRVRLAIVGDFTNYSGKSIRDFIFESNKMGHINFVSSLSEALAKLSKR
ncbi:hypothetical protein D3C87_1608390 [compost metagenome]|uniref:DUF4180 domain-containing protein n=1 Tax=Solitalea canadensis (strain ATCC 29591 / DSM 3403 / JCM 21819 / LMG 8368 / NBRC 15130 / NCIMB 12057 / USAM 9D) TaxID=929556 RepID=H8KM54_SOLCM|nr:DUF4180 domain-containing protein [Solitalea canadensis]AFD08976.1 hypothetical protein Solca_3983 [Solitalea canadensis DSM 3403]